MVRRRLGTFNLTETYEGYQPYFPDVCEFVAGTGTQLTQADDNIHRVAQEGSNI